ncbi:MAG TPA: hypothetical protein VF861_15380 [Telluria sp.]
MDSVAAHCHENVFLAEPLRQRRNRIALGVAVSLMLHALLLATYRNKPPPADVEDAVPARSIAVWLRRLPPPIPERLPEPAAKAEPATPEKPAAKAAPASPSRPATAAPPKRRERVIAITPEPATPSQPDVFAVEPEPPAQPGTANAAPRFDPEAARRMARKLASGPDPAIAGTAVAQFPAKPLQTETRAARAISRTHRRDCKDGIPGGLLAPLLLALDKKDSGCQW